MLMTVIIKNICNITSMQRMTDEFSLTPPGCSIFRKDLSTLPEKGDKQRNPGGKGIPEQSGHGGSRRTGQTDRQGVSLERKNKGKTPYGVGTGDIS